jgi:hypothetical protein
MKVLDASIGSELVSLQGVARRGVSGIAAKIC